MEIEIYNKNWTKDHVDSNPDKIFIFGDNNARVGKGGQATIRGSKNAIGIRTKKGPSKNLVAFYKDSEFEDNKSKIDEDILNIKFLALSGKKIVFSKNGYGTELASLKDKAPKTFKYLCNSLKNHFGFDNEKGTRWSKIPGYDEISKATYIKLDKKSVIDENILQPYTNNFFRHELLEKNLNTTFDIIKSDSKIAFTQNVSYEADTIIIFIVPGLNEYLLVRTIQSYKLDSIEEDKWSMFEGYTNEFIKSIEKSKDEYYQTHFKYICSLDQSGKMIFRDDIFGGYDKPKVSLDKKKSLDKKIEVKNTVKDLNKNNNLSSGVSEINSDNEMTKNDLLYLVNSLKKEIQELKTPFYVKFFRYLKYKFSRKSIDYILNKKDLKGDLSSVNNIFNTDKNKTYYKLVNKKYTHFIVLYRGLLRNKIYIILTFINE